MKKVMSDYEFDGKKVLLRLNYDIPLQNGKIKSNKKILNSLPTIKYLLEKNAKIIIISRFGIIKTVDDVQKYNINEIVTELSNQLNVNIKLTETTRGNDVKEMIDAMSNGDILFIQNASFEDLNDNAETKVNDELARYWASLADIFVNDAFGDAYIKYTSNYGIAKYSKESCIGLVIENEHLKMKEFRNNKDTPYIVILGGTRLSEKYEYIIEMLHDVDKIIIGGSMAHTFAKAEGKSIGKSLFEPQWVEKARDLMIQGRRGMVIPSDYAISNGYADSPRTETNDQNILDNMEGLDIGSETAYNYAQLIKQAKKIYWSGQMGVADFENYKYGTQGIINAIASNSEAVKYASSDDSVESIIDLGKEDKFTFLSTGGISSLLLLIDRELIALETIQNKDGSPVRPIAQEAANTTVEQEKPEIEIDKEK